MVLEKNHIKESNKKLNEDMEHYYKLNTDLEIQLMDLNQ